MAAIPYGDSGRNTILKSKEHRAPSPPPPGAGRASSFLPLPHLARERGGRRVEGGALMGT